MKRPDESGSRDTDLEERLARYDGWIQEGKIPTSSKVIPVHESLSVQQWVVPTEQVLEFLRNARVYALIECVCRSQYQRCDNPLEVCFVINDVADQYLAEGNGRRVSLEEAEERLQNANERGLVHLTIYNPDQHVFAVCSCCSCCCHDLQFLKLYGRGDLIAHSEYVAQTDSNACVHCGECVNRCVFEARVFEDGQLRYDIDACYGCGLCVTVCPEDATVMRRRER